MPEILPCQRSTSTETRLDTAAAQGSPSSLKGTRTWVRRRWNRRWWAQSRNHEFHLRAVCHLPFPRESDFPHGQWNFSIIDGRTRGRGRALWSGSVQSRTSKIDIITALGYPPIARDKNKIPPRVTSVGSSLRVQGIPGPNKFNPTQRCLVSNWASERPRLIWILPIITV
jgi:hypothetical protein